MEKFMSLPSSHLLQKASADPHSKHLRLLLLPKDSPYSVHQLV